MALEGVESGGEAQREMDAAAFAVPSALYGTAPGAPLSPDRLNRRLVHDLRAPLRALRFIPDWIREDASSAGQPLPETVIDHLRMIECQAERMDRFLTGLHELSRLEDTNRTMAQVDLWGALTEAASAVSAPAGIQMHLAPPPTDPRLTVRAVPEDVSLLLRHLIGNAVHHHDRPDGRVWLRLRRTRSTGTIEIADDGPGIPEADQARVFEPFTTLHPRDEVEGAGLGLAIAARVTVMFGGRIEIFSLGRGTLVRVRLPLDPDAK